MASQWFNVTMYDYGFWIINSLTGTNESSSFVLYEGYTVNINATSLPPDSSLGGTANHGVGLTGSASNLSYTQNAPAGSWSQGSFVAPTVADSGATLYCSNYCGTGHTNMRESIVSVVPAPPPPSVAAHANPTQGVSPLTVQFTSSVSGGTAPYIVRWAFGDGATAAGASVSHVYTTGTYVARLAVTDSNGTQNTSSVTITVAAPVPLNVTALASPSSGGAPLTVNFSANASGGVPPYAYLWNFGDGGAGSGSTTSHTYASVGSYTATVEVQDSASETTSASVPVQVTGTGGGPLQLRVTVTPGFGDVPVNVTASASVLGGSGSYGAITWNWGDGSPTVQGVSVRHQFVLTGNFTVTARVTDSKGSSATASSNVSVYPDPLATLDHVVSGSEAPVTATFWFNITGGSGSFVLPQWDFGDGVVVSNLSPRAHTFDRAGTYHVLVNSTDSSGYRVNASVTVQVAAPPGGGGGGTGGKSTGPAPLEFLAGVAGTGLVLLFVSGLQERRSLNRPAGPPADAYAPAEAAPEAVDEAGLEYPADAESSEVPNEE